jgi:hypothetical protein
MKHDEMCPESNRRRDAGKRDGDGGGGGKACRCELINRVRREQHMATCEQIMTMCDARARLLEQADTENRWPDDPHVFNEISRVIYDTIAWGPVPVLKRRKKRA